jgi:anaerobic ribonucleoside-triphosphate reductase
MIETIIITAVVSVISTLVLAYFIWVGISVRKLLKKVEDNKLSIDNHSQNFVNVEQGIYNTIHENEKSINDRLDEYISEHDRNLSSIINELHRRIDETIQEHVLYNDELHRELDKRFDKVHEKLNVTK